LLWQRILASKLAKSAYSPLFVVLALGNGLQYRTSARPCGISTEFSGAITTQFCFTYTHHCYAPRGLHARLCYAFLVESENNDGDNNNNNNSDCAVIVASHGGSSPGSFFMNADHRKRHVAANPQTKPNYLGCQAASIQIHHRHL